MLARTRLAALVLGIFCALTVLPAAPARAQNAFTTETLKTALANLGYEPEASGSSAYVIRRTDNGFTFVVVFALSQDNTSSTCPRI
jgi:hypothetical protein